LLRPSYQHQKTLVRDNFVFVEQLFARERFRPDRCVRHRFFPSPHIDIPLAIRTSAVIGVLGEKKTVMRILPLSVSRKRFVLSETAYFVREKSQPRSVEGQGIYHRNEKQDQQDLDENIEADPKSANSFGSSATLCFNSHCQSLHLRIGMPDR